MTPTYENLIPEDGHEADAQEEALAHEYEDYVPPQDLIRDQVISILGEYGHLLAEQGAPAGNVSAIAAEHAYLIGENVKELANASYRQGQEDIIRVQQEMAAQARQAYMQQAAQAQKAQAAGNGQDQSEAEEEPPTGGQYL